MNMNKTLTDIYFDNLEKYKQGQITLEFWQEVCTALLTLQWYMADCDEPDAPADYEYTLTEKETRYN